MGNSTRHAGPLLTGCLSLAIGVSGIVPTSFSPLLGAGEAHADSDSLVRISQTGPNAHRRLKLGLNKAVVVDLPDDAHDILVSDPTMADAVTRTSRRIYLFGKKVGQTNIFVFGAVDRRSSISTSRSNATSPASKSISAASFRTPTSRSKLSPTTSC